MSSDSTSNSNTGRHDFPWKGNTPGSPELRAKYPLLACLNVPLGTTNYDVQIRQAILRELLQFNEQQGYPPIIASNNRSEQYIVKVPSFQEPQVVRFHRANLHSNFFDNFLAGLLRNHDKQAAVDMLIAYLAKHYNETFMVHVEFATELFEKNEKKKPFVPPANLVMYDGGNIKNPDHVRWNVRYQELLDYKEKHGDCLVPSGKSKQAIPENEKLSRWVTLMRTSNKANNIPPKRRQLLEEAGFVWEVNPNMNRLTDNASWIKSIAAKVFFERITAHDAFCISGFDEAYSSNDSYKKHLNGTVCNYFDGKDMKVRPRVEATVAILNNVGVKGCTSVFGESELLTSLLNEHKLERRFTSNPRPTKKPKPNSKQAPYQSTAPTALNLCDDDRKPSPRPLPLAKNRQGHDGWV